MYGASHRTLSSPNILGTMPNRNNPYAFLFYPVKKPIRTNNHFSMGQFRKFGNDAPRMWVVFKSPQNLLGSLTEISSSRWLIFANVGKPVEKLLACGGRKPDFHVPPLSSMASASLSTLPSEYPFPCASSFSPAANK